VDTLLSSLEVFTGMVGTLQVKDRNTRRAAGEGYILATDLADYLVRKGEAFRTAHDAVARLVSYAVEQGRPLSRLTLDEYKKFSPRFGEDVYLVTVKTSLRVRNNPGGTAPVRVARALARARKMVS
jgi:argininosuccinate lyase